MKQRQYFPLGKAYDDAFCNRVDETQKLLGNIDNGKHTLIIAPRRYGKSSLAERAIALSKLPTVKMNFHLCTQAAELADLLLENVIKLIGQSVGKVDQLITSIKKYLFNLEPLLSFGNDTIQLKLIPKNTVNHAVIIAETLLLLEKLLAEKNRQAVIFLDEFQEITKMSETTSIEGAFRTAAQEMQHVSLIFSGSVRSLLLSMFEDEKRPLYKLCRKIKLERIAESDYEKHIQHIVSKTWGKSLSHETFCQIMICSNRHPYYVNYLCDTIWEACTQLPTRSQVEAAWHQVVVEEWSDALRELSDLPMGQRRLLKYIANNTIINIQSHESIIALDMPASSIGSAVHVLVEKDYIEQDKDSAYRVINPLLLAVLQGAQD